MEEGQKEKINYTVRKKTNFLITTFKTHKKLVEIQSTVNNKKEEALNSAILPLSLPFK